jgi:hypothetical protein
MADLEGSPILPQSAMVWRISDVDIRWQDFWDLTKILPQNPS